jgi:plasmid stabilization system protein ParE
MLEDVIWISGASEDFLEADSRLAPTKAIDGLIELMRLFPDIGTRVRGSDRLRRGLVGRARVYGLYYAVSESRLIIVALLDLRQDPQVIEQILESRTP